MYAKLSCKTGQLAGKVFYVTDDATIGSSPECAIYVRHGIVSTRHARVLFDPKKSCFFLEDLKSYNGTKVDGKVLHGKMRLGDHHTIILANTFEFAFQTLQGDPPEEEPDLDEAVNPAPPGEATVKAQAPDDDKMAKTIILDYNDMFKELPKATESFFLEFKTVKAGKQSVRLRDGENTVGRSNATDITIDNPSISRQHAVITVQQEKVLVRDVGSRNGTFVDERRISTEMEIPPEVEIRFGLINASIVKKVEPARH